MILTRKMIDKIFEEAVKTEEYIIALYKLVFPDFDKITDIEGYPEAGKDVNTYIFLKAMRFDKENGVKFPAGMWFNRGFSTINKKIKGWEVSTKNCKITY